MFMACFVLFVMVLQVMVLFIFCFRVLLILASAGILLHVFGFVQVCLLLITLLALFSIFKDAIVDAWNTKVCGDLGVRAGFRGGTRLDLKGSLQLLSASHLRERDKGLLRGVLSGEVWNGFLLGHARGEIVPCRFCGEADGDGHLFWDCTHPPFVHILEIPEFHGLLNKDKSTWLRCLLWHGWSPALASPGGDSP